ncbi:MAG: hypothetical protein U0414_06430 [Polyangiaceae bacterium]
MRNERREWLGRGIVGIAAVASVATEQARWELDAVLPAVTTGSGGKGLLVTIEASAPAHVHVGDEAIPPWNRAVGDAWTGTGQYLLDPGQVLGAVGLAGTCGGCANCSPPQGTFVRVVSTDEVFVWRLESTSPGTTSNRAVVEATSTPEVVSEEAGRVSTCSVARSPGSGTPATYEITCYPRTLTPTLRASLRGTCTSSPCSPPASASVAFRSPPR